ncbi:MAG: type II toxin-antitoxin system Phd/YefM family antitoxin [Deltaproteobacteria bacterium]|nr:type II toxin-antitoxin system Phd/YefM family antitoxin [Deltaproteobacteria bacterium]MBI3295454.1 type II toxin-antitoxin system Phd/YefM family antitoxin [Deltaproteobacteria bacterium]
MRHKTISISKAKATLLELVRKVNDEGNAYLLTRDGEAISALVPLEDYEALLESSDVRFDAQTMKDLRSALDDEKKGRLWRRDTSGKWIRVKKRAKAA